MFKKENLKFGKYMGFILVAYILISNLFDVVGYGVQCYKEVNYEKNGYIHTKVKILEVDENKTGYGRGSHYQYNVRYEYSDPNNKTHERKILDAEYSKNMKENCTVYGWLNSKDYEDLNIEYGYKYYLGKMANRLIVVVISDGFAFIWIYIFATNRSGRSTGHGEKRS